jgi:transcriptional regulator with XRE-family HTH domain
MNEKETFLIEFGKHLQKLRKEKGLSIREMEYRGETDRDLISKIENGKSNPTIFTIKNLLEVLEISFEEFFKGFHNKKS